MKVIAVDQSFSSSGIVVLDEEGDVEFAERYVSDNNDDIFSRAWEISTSIAETRREHKCSVCVVEGLAFGAFGDATRNLAGLQFVIYSVMKFIEGCDVEIVVPGTVKKFATGSGKATKQEMIENLPEHVLDYFKSLGVKKTTGLSDLADAYWIGKYFQKNSQEVVKENKELGKTLIEEEVDD